MSTKKHDDNDHATTTSILKGRDLLDIAKEFTEFQHKEFYSIGVGRFIQLRTLSNTSGTREIYVLSGSCITGIEIFEDRLEALHQFVDLANDLRAIEMNQER